MHKLYKKQIKAFTMIELIIAIVVIGILSVIVVVGYSGWQRRVVETQIKSDLNAVVSAMESYRNFNDGYPESIPTSFKSSEDVAISGGSSDGGKSFCIDAVSNRDSNIKYFVSSIVDKNQAKPGECSSVPTVPVVASPTATDITTTSAALGATITSSGSGQVTESGACWGHSPKPTTNCVNGLGALGLNGKNSIAFDGFYDKMAASSDGKHLYVVESDYDTIHVFSRDNTNGELTPILDANIGTELNPSDIAISSNGASVYVSNSNSNTISMYSRNSTTGFLSPLSTPTITTELSPASIAISDNGASVYVTNADSSTVSMYSRNTTTGLLSPLSTPTIAAGSYPMDIVISDNGASVYVVNLGSDTVSMYSRNTTTGLLSPLSTPTIATEGGPTSIAISSGTSNSVYVTCEGSDSVSMYSRNTTTGLLSPLSTPSISVGDYPNDIAVSNGGTSVYVLNEFSDEVYIFSRNTSTGMLTEAINPLIQTGNRPRSILITDDDKSLYVSSDEFDDIIKNSGIHYLRVVGDSTITNYVRNTTNGILTNQDIPYVFTDPSGPAANIYISDDGKFAYVTSYGDSSLIVYSRDLNNGRLSPLNIAPVATGNYPSNIDISNDGTSLYVVNSYSDTISMYSRNVTTGLLTPLSTPVMATEGLPSDVVVSSDGKFVYVSCGSGVVNMYSRNTSTGMLAPLSTAYVVSDLGSLGITISDDDKFVYTANSNSGTISMFSRNVTTGLLSPLSPISVKAGDFTCDIEISDDGNNVYATNAYSGSISMYSRNATTGLLAPLSPATVTTGVAPVKIALSSDGMSAYVANASDSNISVYSRDIDTGLLKMATKLTIPTADHTNNIVLSSDNKSLYAVSFEYSAIVMYSRSGNQPTFSKTRVGLYQPDYSKPIYYRGFATNQSGTGYSGDATFYLKPPAPDSVDVTYENDNNTTTFSWTTPTCSIGTSPKYQYRYYIDPTGYDSGWVDTVNTSASFTTATIEQEYYLTVRAGCYNTNTSSEWGYEDWDSYYHEGTLLEIDPDNWIQIGTQVWARYNLNVGTRIVSTTAQTNNGGSNIVEKYCYDDLESNCTLYGGLYQWNEAMGYSITEGSQGICPAGSHIPTDNEWKTLEMFLGMTQAQADEMSWRGTNQGTQVVVGGSSGLNFPMSGFSYTNGGFGGATYRAHIWTSSLRNLSSAYFRWLEMPPGYTQIARSSDAFNFGFTIRCLSD